MKEKLPMSARDIATRLDNWGLCERGRVRGGSVMVTRETRRTSTAGSAGHITGAVCDMMRAAAKGPAGGSATQSRLDFEDSATIKRAWLKLGPRHRLLLRDFYVLGRPPNILCRELSIKHWPASHWERELRWAQEAIEDLAGNWGNR